MTSFRTNKQGKAYPLNPRQQKAPTYQKFLDIPIPAQKTIIENVFAWYGCYALPGQCLVIKGINIAYKRYKNKPLNRQYEDNVENIVNRGMQKFASSVAEDEINKVSKEIIIQINESDLISNISDITKINENVIKDFMEGTISNLLKDKIENGTGFLVNNVIL